jgi:hypothetical protein
MIGRVRSIHILRRTGISAAGSDCFSGDPKNSHPGQLKQLSPSDPLLVHTKGGTAWRRLRAGRYDDALSRAKRALLENPHYKPALRATAAITACLGMRNEARKVIARTGQVVCAFRIGDAGRSGRTTWKSSKTAFERLAFRNDRMMNLIAGLCRSQRGRPLHKCI